jgi:hypothetical protein
LPAADRPRRLLGAAGLVLLVTLAARWLQTEGGIPSWNEASRMAAVQSLVEGGTWRIDESPFLFTGDKMRFDGHYYSDKPPLLAALAAAPYGFLHHVFGLRLHADECVAGEPCGRRWMTFLVVGVPSALLTAAFVQLAGRFLPLAAALAAAGLLAFGTMVWPYSLVFMNHVPAAACLFGSFAALLTPGDPPRPLRLAAAGGLAGLAASFDLPCVFPAGALAVLAVARHRRSAVPFFLGLSLPLAASMLVDWQISGSPLPPAFRTEGWSWPGSPFPQTVSGLKPPRSVGAHALESLLGYRGLLSHCPLLILGLIGLARVAADARHPMRTAAMAVAAGTTAYVAFILTRTDSQGGQAYGQRYLLAPVPLILFFAVFVVPASATARRRVLLAAVLGAASAVSVASAWKGSQAIWTVVTPPLYVGSSPRAPYPTVCSGLEDPPWCLQWRRWWRRWRRDLRGATVIASPAVVAVPPPQPSS